MINKFKDLVSNIFGLRNKEAESAATEVPYKVETPVVTETTKVEPVKAKPAAQKKTPAQAAAPAKKKPAKPANNVPAPAIKATKARAAKKPKETS